MQLSISHTFKHNLTVAVVATQSLLVGWSWYASTTAAGPWSAAAISYVLFVFYVLYAWFAHDAVLKTLVVIGTVAGLLELATDHYLVDTINSLVYPGNEVMVWSSPAYMPFAWANVLIQLGYYGILLSKWKGAMTAAIILGIAGAFYIPLYEHLAKDAGWWWYHDNVKMVFNAPVYVIICEGLISCSLPWLLLSADNFRWKRALLMGVLCGGWIYLSAVLAYLIGG